MSAGAGSQAPLSCWRRTCFHPFVAVVSQRQQLVGVAPASSATRTILRSDVARERARVDDAAEKLMILHHLESQVDLVSGRRQVLEVVHAVRVEIG